MCLPLPFITCLRRHGFLGGFVDQPTQGYNGNMPSRWVRIVGVWDTGLALLEKGLLVVHLFSLLMAHYTCATSITPLEFFTTGAPLVRH